MVTDSRIWGHSPNGLSCLFHNLLSSPSQRIPCPLLTLLILFLQTFNVNKIGLMDRILSTWSSQAPRELIVGEVRLASFLNSFILPFLLISHFTLGYLGGFLGSNRLC